MHVLQAVAEGDRVLFEKWGSFYSLYMEKYHHPREGKPVHMGREHVYMGFSQANGVQYDLNVRGPEDLEEAIFQKRLEVDMPKVCQSCGKVVSQVLTDANSNNLCSPCYGKVGKSPVGKVDERGQVDESGRVLLTD